MIGGNDCRYCRHALSNIGRTGTEVGRHLDVDPTITLHSLGLSKWSGRPPHELITEAHVLITGQRFHKNIVELIFRRGMLNFNEPLFQRGHESEKGAQKYVWSWDESCGPIGLLQCMHHCLRKYGKPLEV